METKELSFTQEERTIIAEYIFSYQTDILIKGDVLSLLDLFLKKELITKDGYVYHYPHIEIRMSNGSLNTKYFKTEEDLKEYYDNFLAPLNLIDA